MAEPKTKQTHMLNIADFKAEFHRAFTNIPNGGHFLKSQILNPSHLK
jgi:hypothetical protein